MLSGVMLRKAFELQKYKATKSLFRAVADGKCIVVYGPSGSGKSTLINENEMLLKDYSHMYLNMHSETQLKKILCNKGLFIAEGIYNGERKIHLPRDDIVEIFLAVSLGARTNELSYE